MSAWICIACNLPISGISELYKHLEQAEKKKPRCAKPVFLGDLEE